MEVRAFQTPPRRLEGEGENNLLSQQPLPSPPALTFRALAPQKLVVHRVLRPLDGLESVFEGGAACEKIERCQFKHVSSFVCVQTFFFFLRRGTRWRVRTSATGSRGWGRCGAGGVRALTMVQQVGRTRG